MDLDQVKPGWRLEVGDAAAEVLRGWDKPAGRAIRVGLSGGIGSGKSTVAAVWGRAGATVVSADEVAREVVAPGTSGLAAVVARFGPEVLRADGALDRSRLAKIAFASQAGRRALESITHPLIAARVRAVERLTPPESIFVYDVPLLVENDMGADFDCVVMVSADDETRLNRLERRGLSRPDAVARMRSQASSQARRTVSNIWIENHGSEGDVLDLASAVYLWL